MNKQHYTNTTFIPNTLELVNQLNFDTEHWLTDYRQSQFSQLMKTPFPHRKIEHFKYNHLHAFDECDFNTLAEIDNNIDLTHYQIANLTDKNATQIVFINGILSLENSQFQQHKIASFDNTNNEQQQKILAMLDRQETNNNIFNLYNGCLTGVNNNAVLIEIDNDSSSDIIEIIHINTKNAQAKSANSQIFIDIAENCQAKIISRVISEDNQTPCLLSTQRIMVNIGDNATLHHYNLALENSHSLHFANICYNLHNQSYLNAFHVATGSNLKKLDVQANHLGEYATAKINGIYVATGDEQVDFHTEVNHPFANGTMDENFRGLVNGRAEAVFNGRIHIYENAQKTLAEMSNKNLILSDTALLHTKPELEIYADDVVCAHGATVSRLQETALNYLRARGISKKEAELMLSYAFFDELLEEIEEQAVIDYIRPILFECFEGE